MDEDDEDGERKKGYCYYSEKERKGEQLFFFFLLFRCLNFWRGEKKVKGIAVGEVREDKMFRVYRTD